MSNNFLLIVLLFALLAATFAAPFNNKLHKRKLQQANDDGLQFEDDDEGEADDDAGIVDDDYFFGDDDLTRIDDDDDGFDDDNDIVSFPPNTSDYETHGAASSLAPAAILSVVAMIMF